MLGGLNTTSPNGYLDSVTANDGVTLSGSMTVSLGNGTKATFQVGSGTSGNGTFYTGSGSGYNTLDGLAAAINAAPPNTPVTYSGDQAAIAARFTVTNTDRADRRRARTGRRLHGPGGHWHNANGSDGRCESAEGGTTLSDIASYINDPTTRRLWASRHRSWTTATARRRCRCHLLTGGALTVASDLVIPGPGRDGICDHQQRIVLALADQPGLGNERRADSDFRPYRQHAESAYLHRHASRHRLGYRYRNIGRSERERSPWRESWSFR